MYRELWHITKHFILIKMVLATYSLHLVEKGKIIAEKFGNGLKILYLCIIPRTQGQ